MERYYTPEQLETLGRAPTRSARRACKAQDDWAALIAEVEAERLAGTDPADPRLDPLVERWTGLIEQFTGGDPGIRASSQKLYETRGGEGLAGDASTMDYAGRAFARAPRGRRRGEARRARSFASDLRTASRRRPGGARARSRPGAGYSLAAPDARATPWMIDWPRSQPCQGRRVAARPRRYARAAGPSRQRPRRASPARCAIGWSSGSRAGDAPTATTRPRGSARWWSARPACSTRRRATALAARVAERAVGLGPLEPLLRDPGVDELMVAGPGPSGSSAAAGSRQTEVALRQRGRAAARDRADPGAARAARRRGRAAGDARLPDGSRVNVVLPPLALDGPLLTIRRFRPRGFAPADLVAHGTLARRCSTSSAARSRARCTLLICGGTGSGKTTTLGALAAFVDPAERVVTIEDAAELRLPLPHVVRLEARPPNLEGRGEVTIRRLVRNALRMRPDRLIVGEVRGAEALDLLVALSTGHAGSLCTIHAAAPPRRCAGSRRSR